MVVPPGFSSQALEPFSGNPLGRLEPCCFCYSSDSSPGPGPLLSPPFTLAPLEQDARHPLPRGGFRTSSRLHQSNKQLRLSLRNRDGLNETETFEWGRLIPGAHPALALPPDITADFVFSPRKRTPEDPGSLVVLATVCKHWGFSTPSIRHDRFSWEDEDNLGFLERRLLRARNHPTSLYFDLVRWHLRFAHCGEESISVRVQS
jgi:hypothetical protein